MNFTDLPTETLEEIFIHPVNQWLENKTGKPGFRGSWSIESRRAFKELRSYQNINEQCRSIIQYRMMKGVEGLDRQDLVKLVGRAVREAPQDHLFVVQLAYSSKKMDRFQESCTGTSSLETVLLCLAARSGRCDVIRFLLSKGARIEAVAALDRDEELYMNALHHSISRKQEDAVRLILEHGANVNSQAISSKATALQKAIGCLGITRLLVEKGADVNLGEDMSPLHFAAVDGSVEEVELLLAHGANIEQTMMYDTPLMLSCQARNFKVARKLLEYGANINAQVPESAESLGGVTPLYYAITATGMFPRHSTTKETVEVLLDYGADIKKTYEIRHDWGDNMAEYTVQPFAESTKSILSIAINAGNPSVVELLLDRSAEWKDTDPNRSTPLQAWIVSRPESWCKSKGLPMLEVLLRHGSDPNEYIYNGNTPLIEACHGKPLLESRFVIGELLRCGANASRASTTGDSVLRTIFRGHSYAEMLHILRDIEQYSTGTAQANLLRVIDQLKKKVQEEGSLASPVPMEELMLSDGSEGWSSPESNTRSVSESE